MVSVKAELTKRPLAKTIAPAATIQESDIAAVFDPDVATTSRPKYRDFIDSLKFDFDLRLGMIGYALDDQSSPRIHPLVDSEGSQRFRFGGRSYKRDKKYTAGATVAAPTVTYDPAAGSPIELETLLLLIGGTKATAGAADIQKVNSADKVLGFWARDGAITSNEMLALPNPGERQETVASTDVYQDTTWRSLIHNPDKLQVKVRTMVLNEIFTIRARFLVHGPTDPTVTVHADLTEAAE